MEICLVCNRSFKTKRGLSYHITITEKIKYKDYYDKFLKRENEDKCKMCGKEVPFNKNSYNVYCNRKCISKDIVLVKQKNEKSKKTCLKKYGTEYNSQSMEHKKKVRDWWKNLTNKDKIELRNKNIKETSIKKYGVDNPAKSENSRKKISKTKQNFSNALNKEINKKREETCLKKYGADNVRKSTKIIQKIKDIKLKKYGTLCFVKNLSYSKASQEFFKILIELNSDIVKDFQYATYGKEFCIKKDVGNRFYYDFTCHNLKKIIEYNGECFHPIENLKDSDAGWYIRDKSLTAGEVRKKEMEKEKMANEYGYDLLKIWYSDDINNSLIKATNFLRGTNEK